MSTNENKQEAPQDADKESPIEEKKAENSNNKTEYKGNNPGGTASKKS